MHSEITSTHHGPDLRPEHVEPLVQPLGVLHAAVVRGRG